MEKILELNLIKSKINNIETRRRYSRYSRIIYLIATVFFVVTTVNFVVLSVKISKANKKLSSLEVSIASKRDTFGLAGMEKQWQGYLSELKSVNSIINARSAWSGKLKELANLLPRDMCISSVGVSLEENRKNFVIEIMTIPNEQKGFRDIENFITALENDRFIGKGVKLESHERRLVNKRDIEIFKVVLPQDLGKK